MQFPTSFNTTREPLENLCQPIKTIGLHSYETPTAVSSAKGAILLANAIQDITRQTRPNHWHAVVLFAINETAEQLSNKLQNINEHCPLKTFIEAQRFAESLNNITTHKMQVATGNEQSVEWTFFDDCRSIPALNSAFNDASLALVDDESKALISDIDSAIAEISGLVSARNSRLSQTKFTSSSLNIESVNVTANSARSLANAIKKLGNNNMHWAYLAFVGSSNELNPIKELFL